MTQLFGRKPWCTLRATAAALLALCLSGAALADEAMIRKNLAERLPQLPKIDEVTRTPHRRPV
jgi:thiol:disulfide interchange protein DsbC